ncbi:MAG: outer membrane protein assembly factor [Fusobacterium sp.]|nr:outer membrane protein assembly factor [Fusobacterium sp.]
MKKKVIVLLMLLLSLSVFAELTNLPIKHINIINNTQVPNEVIKANMKMNEGDVFKTENMLEDFKSLKNTGYFDDVVINPTSFDGGVKIAISVVEKPNVMALLSKKGIVGLQDRGDIDKSLIISNISISGNKFLADNEILPLMNLNTGEYYSKSKVLNTQKALLASGYFSNVVPRTVKNGGKLSLNFEVTENPIIRDVLITGNTVFEDEQLKSLLASKVGKVQNYNALNEDRNRILEAYNRSGFTLVNISDMKLDENNNLRINIVEGIVRSIQVKKMITKQKGNRRKPNDDTLKTKSYVIDREIEIIPGKIFNNNDYQATLNNLMRLGIFKNVKYEARSIPGDPQGINLILLIDEDRTATLQGSISYGSEVGFMGSVALKDINWNGKGQEFGFNVEKSNKNYTGFNINFFDPWIKNTDRVSWGWGAYKTSYGDGSSNLFGDINTLGFKVNIGKGLSRNVVLSIGAKVEQVKEKHSKGAFAPDKQGNFYYPHGWLKHSKDIKGEKSWLHPITGIDDKYLIWSVYPYLSYDSRNNYYNPTKGTFAKFQIEAGHAGGYKADYFGNATLELRKYHKGLFKNNIFAYRAIAGYMTKSTKESQRFWVGGGNSLRGYDGGFFKGTQKVVATIENRTQINDILGIVLFADAGRAWKNEGRDPNYDPFDQGQYVRKSGKDRARLGRNIATTAGVGLRLNTPMGPLRFDFGWPVGNKMDKEGMKFYFNMGQSF